PLVRDAIRATSFHGKDGLGDSNLPLSKIHPAEKNAIETMSNELAISKHRDLTLICTGPLTNIAALLTGFPESAKMIKELMIMGGVYGVTEYDVGNVQVETRGEITAGMTVADRREWLPEGKTPGKKMMICKDVDSRGFKRLFLDRLTSPMSS